MSTPTLHDDRVEKMRMSVMHRVDQDVTRRGRRARTVVGLSIAGVLVVGLGGYAVSSLDGTGVSEISADSARSDDYSGGRAAAPEAQLDAQDGTAKLSQSEAAAKQPAPAADRQIITTGSASVTVDRPRTTVQQLSTWIESVG